REEDRKQRRGLGAARHRRFAHEVGALAPQQRRPVPDDQALREARLRLDVAPPRRPREAVDRFVMTARGVVPLGHLDVGCGSAHGAGTRYELDGLLDAQPMQHAELAADEYIEREAPSLV